VFRTRWERWLKRLLTVDMRANFFCDSHPWCCVHCHRLRDVLKGYPYPSPFVVVATKKGRYIWSRFKIKA